MDGISPLPQGFSVSVDGLDPVSFSFGLDRDMAKVQGQSHRISVTGLSAGKSVQKNITLDLNDEMAILSIPKLVAGIEPAVTKFIPKAAVPVTNENRDGDNQFTSPGSAEPGAELPVPDGGAVSPDGAIVP
jgi:hypothetical protein